MDCREYTENCLGADVDGELSAEERRAVDEHLAGCPRCGAELAQERAFKRALRERLHFVEAPPALRASIRAALDRAEATTVPAPRRFAGFLGELLSPQMWAPLAALASAIIFVMTMRDRIAPAMPIPQFDPVIESFRHFEKHFEPNVPSGSFADIAGHYHDAHMPSSLWDFNPFGFKLVGGRLDKLSDGRRVTYTLYRGAKGAIMCARFSTDDLSVPLGGRELRTDQYAYSYKGYSVVYSLDVERHFVCLLISGMPSQEFTQDIEYLES